MRPLMKALLIFSIILVAGSFLAVAAEKDEKDSSLFVWSWDVKEDHEKFPLTKNYFWSPPEDFIALGVRYMNAQLEGTGDDQDDLTYGVSFRPLAFRFNDIIITAGLYFTNGYGNGEQKSDIYLPDFDVTVNPRINAWSRSASAGASFFASVPSYGLQFFFEIGHFWGLGGANTRFQFNQMVDLGFGPIPTEFDGKARFKQRDAGVELWFEVNYFVDRLYLYGFTFDFFAALGTGVSKASTKTVINYRNEFDQGTIYNEEDVPADKADFLLGLISLKAFALEVLAHETWGKQRITFEPLLGLGHFHEINGHDWLLGIRLNFFDIFGFQWVYVWEVKNDQPNIMLFSVDVGLRFGVGLGGTSIKRKPF